MNKGQIKTMTERNAFFNDAVKKCIYNGFQYDQFFLEETLGGSNVTVRLREHFKRF